MSRKQVSYDGLEKVLATDKVNVGDIMVRHEGNVEGSLIKVIKYSQTDEEKFKRGWIHDNGRIEVEDNYGGNRFMATYYWYQKDELLRAEDL